MITYYQPQKLAFEIAKQFNKKIVSFKGLKTSIHTIVKTTLLAHYSPSIQRTAPKKR